MSNDFLQFTTQYGIQRYHLTWNKPQNSLTERANKTIGEYITIILVELGILHLFLGCYLVFIVHIWNRLPTVPLFNTTSFEDFYKWKPNISYLRV